MMGVCSPVQSMGRRRSSGVTEYLQKVAESGGLPADASGATATTVPGAACIDGGEDADAALELLGEPDEDGEPDDDWDAPGQHGRPGLEHEPALDGVPAVHGGAPGRAAATAAAGSPFEFLAALADGSSASQQNSQQVRLWVF